MTDNRLLIAALRANADLTEKALDFMADPERIEESKADIALWRAAAERLEKLDVGLSELLSVAERTRSGDQSLNPEEWYAIRDYCRMLVKDEG